MKKLIFYKYTTIGLILLNICVLGFLLLTRTQNEPRPPRPKANFREEAIQILKLNVEQQAHFKVLVEGHEHQIRNINRQQERILTSFLKRTTSNLLEIDTLILDSFGRIQRQKLQITQHHLLEIKELLREEQLPYFGIFTDRVTKRIATKNKNNLHRPKDF